jgi:hypothetical protein
MMKIFKSYAEEVDDGSYLVVSRGVETRLPGH